MPRDLDSGLLVMAAHVPAGRSRDGMGLIKALRQVGDRRRWGCEGGIDLMGVMGSWDLGVRRRAWVQGSADQV